MPTSNDKGAPPSGLDRLLRPKSVAIVGASEKPGALGASVLNNLERQGFDGAIHLINPKRAEIAGRRCLSSIDDLPEGVDVAILAIPRAGILEAVCALGERRVAAAIIFAAGFAEGGESGAGEQLELARIAARTGMIIEGPNCLGLVNFVDGIPLTFVELPAARLAGRPGLAIVSQSGAMAAVLGITMLSREVGLSYSISTGNEAATGVEAFVERLVDDPHTQAIAMIVEQFRAPARFLAAAERARSAGKPIILLHPGRSAAARASAATHTGALAGDHALMTAKVERAGVIVAASLEGLGDVCEILLNAPPMTAGGSAVLCESGAYKALTLDLAERLALPLPSICDEDSPALRAALPDFVPVTNPVDLTAQGLSEPDLYRRAIGAVLDDDRFGSILIAVIQTDPVTAGIKFPAIIEALGAQFLAKPVIVAGLDEGAMLPDAFVAALRQLGAPYFPTSERVLRALASIADWKRRDYSRQAETERRTTGLPRLPGVVPEHKAKAILGSLGIPFPQSTLTKTLGEAQAAAERLGYPVVLKAQSADLPHKTEAGGVIVNLRDVKQLTEGWERLSASVARFRPGLVLDGVLVEAMGLPGVELIIGGRNDPDWGPVILVGFGGIQAEVLKDVRLIAPDMTVAGISAELNALRSAPLLRGFRGAPALDVPAVAELVSNLGQIMLANPAIGEVDLNPVIVYPMGQGVVALDALVQVGAA